MLNRFNIAVTVTIVAVVLTFVATVILRDANPGVSAAVILILVLIGGAGLGSSLSFHDSRR
jgi:hypothetical protein